VKVVYFQRKPRPGYLSIEKVFDTVRKCLPSDIEYVVKTCPYESKGILKRILNILWVWRHQGDVNHITGDVHYLAILLKKKKTILTIHDLNFLIRCRGIRKFIIWFFWYYIPVKRCSIITTISEFTKKELLKSVKCKPEKIHVVYDPVPVLFTYSPQKFNSEYPTILMVGTMWNKNLERVAQALKGISCRLEIVGELSEKQKMILDENGVIYKNHVDMSEEELYSLYKLSDLVVFASLYEGFGLPIIEAQAVGRPVVTSNCCSMPEVAGGGACLVNPESIESIREGILRIMKDEKYRNQIIEMGFKNVKRFQPDLIAKQYARLYQKIIN
jgi:glycosyltransferase involved in cell wall biosynthesis